MQKNFTFRKDSNTGFLLTDNTFSLLHGGAIETCGDETARIMLRRPVPLTCAARLLMTLRLRLSILIKH